MVGLCTARTRPLFWIRPEIAKDMSCELVQIG